MIKSVLYVDQHLMYFVIDKGDGSTYNKTVNGVDITVIYNSYAAKTLLDKQHFDGLGLHLSTDGAYRVAVEFRKKNRRSPITIYSSTAGFAETKEDLDKSGFPYDSLVHVSLDELMSDYEIMLERIVKDFIE